MFQLKKDMRKKLLKETAIKIFIKSMTNHKTRVRCLRAASAPIASMSLAHSMRAASAPSPPRVLACSSVRARAIGVGAGMERMGAGTGMPS